MHEIKIICQERTTMGREKGLRRATKEQDEDAEEDPYRVKQGLHTNKMEGETRGGVLEDKADNSKMKCSILSEVL